MNHPLAKWSLFVARDPGGAHRIEYRVRPLPETNPKIRSSWVISSASHVTFTFLCIHTFAMRSSSPTARAKFSQAGTSPAEN